ncbi:MAG TPA: carboxypeptidase regulatory-like domain-containing protein, partial [Armatimonadota bacterium]|nr:carboxypeptidase regulatory-like domain-containing protein [Armatimonadota bacterium]
FADGLEGVSQEYTSDSNFSNHTLNLRNHLAHNTICWMRTGTIYGVVQLTAGLAPAKGVLVRAYENKSLNNRTIMGQAFTREDGTYEIQGLPSSIYRVEAILPGYTYDHGQRDAVHGAGRTEMDFKLSEAPPGSISGRVTNTDGTTAIAGAGGTITLQGTYKGQPLEKTVQTDQFGVYSVPDLPTGLYQVKTSSDGYQDQTYASLVQVNPGAETANINFVMGGAPGGIAGTITRQSDGQPVAGATVELRAGTTLVASTTTDDSGKYAFPSVSAGTYQVTVTAGTGILATSATVTVAANTQARCNIAANTPEPAFVAGKVTDASGNLVSGALIEAVSNGKVVKSTTSGPTQTTGSTTYNYKLTGLNAGSYTIQVSKSGYSGSSSNVTLTESQQLYNVNFTLQSLHAFSSGLTMVSAPYDYSDQDAAAFLGLTASQVKMAQWVGSRYAYYPEAPSDRFRIGRGYFMKSDRAISVTKQGRAVDTTAPYAISLTTGWNMIGNPFPFIV